MSVVIRQIAAPEVGVMQALLGMFGEAFDDQATYTGKQPSVAYLERLLASDTFIALAAVQGEQVVGGIAAYELRKFEQERSGRHGAR